ncbi:FAD-dependent oxidoreductase [Novosphingobium sp. Gsoil 351]|uniref:FAD-dependent oxidoreductase n=1 Tax=Novosphingobium sp. Gsoil 351 TaxID=2675225 RepID=UPI0012B4FCC6|nr:FAD-dependent oxidoreductase [Novosphingobium sp. Gsoil 351]QGN54281.1 FAD-dependent oxidoreductase [Novosphingobium sp. Gsoil 351]
MNEETDVIVLGSGAAGLTAALAAHESGARVRLIERFDRVGGTSAVSGGVIWVADNPRQRAAGMADGRVDALAYFRSLDHGDLRDDVLEAFVDAGPEALDFLERIDALRVSLLAGYPDYYLDRPGAKPEGGRALDHDLFALGELGEWAARIYAIEEPKPMMLRETALGGGSGVVEPHELQRRLAADERGFGQAMVARLLKACLARGIEPELGVTTKRLIAEQGRVTGIEGERAGRPFALHASGGVIVATGGFEWDADLRRTFLRGPADTPASPPTARGEGLALAMAAGARLGNMTSAWWAPTLAPPGDRWATGEQRAAPVLIERTVPHSLMVNRAGQRFCNEAANYSALAGAFHAFDPQTYSYQNQPAWLIFDAQYRARYPVGTIMPGQPLPDWIASADTLGELAAKIGVDEAGLTTTVERFNRNARDGHDPDFARGTSAYDHFYGDRSRTGTAVTLGPVEQAPYFAVEIRMGMLGTNGGPQTDGAGQMLDHAGEPIPGLYGAGNAIACPTGGVYAGAGGTLGPALTFGYIAGRSAARANAP